MATSEEASATAAAEVPPQSQPHKLERKWTFWFDNISKPKQGAAAAWGSSMRKVYTFDSVEEFWWYATNTHTLDMALLYVIFNWVCFFLL